MKFDDLRAIWKKQQAALDEWAEELVRGAYSIKKKVGAELGVDESTVWTDPHTKTQHRYLCLVDPVSEERKELRGPVFPPACFKNGVLRVAISITLDHDKNTFPKRGYYAAIGIRFSKQNIQFTTWDAENDEPFKGATWRTEDEQVKDIFESIERFFSFDPKEGHRERAPIGFI